MKRVACMLSLLLVGNAAAQRSVINTDSITIVQAHRPAVTALSYSPDGRTLATAGNDRTVRIWNASSGRLVRTLRGHTDDVFTAVFSNDGRMLASSSYDRNVLVWDIATGALISRIRLATWSTAMRFASGDSLIVGDQGGALRLYAARSGRQLSECRVDAPVNSVVVTTGLDGVLIGGPVAVWNLRSCAKGPPIRTFGGVTDIAQAQGAHVIATGHMRGNAYVRNADGMTLIHSVASVRTAAITSIRGTVTDTVRVAITAVALSPDGKRLVWGDARGRVRLKTVGIAGTEREFTGHRGAVTAIAFSPNGDWLATAGTDGVVRLRKLP